MEIVEGEFSVRHEAEVLHRSRKLFAYSFLSERNTSGVMPDRKPYAQSFLWERRTSGIMPGRKPYAQSFLWERRTSGVMLDRKPFAKSFLSGMKPQCFSRVGNSLQIVSHLV